VLPPDALEFRNFGQPEIEIVLIGSGCAAGCHHWLGASVPLVDALAGTVVDDHRLPADRPREGRRAGIVEAAMEADEVEIDSAELVHWADQPHVILALEIPETEITEAAVADQQADHALVFGLGGSHPCSVGA
jgi:hypothetical protein